MKKVLFECMGNAVLFVLFALALLYPVVVEEATVSTNGFSYSVSLSGYLLLFVVCCLVYAVVRHVFVKRNRIAVGAMGNLELACDDEREQALSANALRAAYFAAMLGLFGCLFVFATVYFFSTATGAASAELMYRVAVIGVVVALEMVNAVYCIRWCVAYRV